MELSVVIVSYNVREFLEKSLRSIYRASANIECEIIVVDNNSDDGSCRMVEQSFPAVILLKNLTNAGFSAANNKAIRIARGRYILLLNPDTIVGDDTFTKCISFMNENPDAGAVGVRMVDGRGSYLPESKRAIPTPSAAFFKTFGIARLFPRSKHFSSYYSLHVDQMATSEVEVLAGAYMFIRAETLKKTGLLDEDYFMYGEDVDLSIRIMKAGYKNYYLPETTIVHYKGKSTLRNGYTDIHHFYNAMRIYIRKREAEGEFRYIKNILIAGTYVRQSLALIARFVKLLLSR
jgi:O-antigen biosynthesis protein